MTDSVATPTEIRAELDKFDALAEKLIISFVDPIEALPPPPLAYHYTNDVGLRGILESGKVWLTDIFSLNDPSELSHGFSHIVKILHEMAAEGQPETKLFASKMEAFATHGGIQAAAHYFVCSFSATGDDLGQWRAYADNGRGYALGFDTKMLETVHTRDGDKPLPNNSTFPVTYDDVQLANLHRQLAEAAFPLISLPRRHKLSNEVLRAYMQELSISVAMHALRATLFFKHHAYSNEQEYRFLQVYRADVPAPDVKLRSRPHVLVRYREFDWRNAAPNCLKQIVIGPAADPEIARRFVVDCLAAFHAGPVEIMRSNIPYRAT